MNEGPKVKVGDIDIAGNKAFNDRWVIRAMKNLQPYRHPALDLRSRTCSPRPSTRPSSKKTRSASAQAYQDNGYFTAKVLDETVKICATRADTAARSAADQAEQRRASAPTSRSRWKKAGCTT